MSVKLNCKNCGEEKPLVKFRSRKDGSQHICRKCSVSPEAKERYLARKRENYNKEKNSNKCKAYRAKNPERCKQSNRDYYNKNKEIIKSRSNNTYMANKEDNLARMKNWRKQKLLENPGYFKELAKNHRLIIKTGSMIGKELIENRGVMSLRRWRKLIALVEGQKNIMLQAISLTRNGLVY